MMDNARELGASQESLDTDLFGVLGGIWNSLKSK
jgi:hypothetical protein